MSTRTALVLGAVFGGVLAGIVIRYGNWRGR